MLEYELALENAKKHSREKDVGTVKQSSKDKLMNKKVQKKINMEVEQKR